MATIYCIEDINDLKYVGSTNQKLNDRLYGHRSAKKKNDSITSSKLNLYNCIIYPLETCSESDRFEREKYWINKIDCVNERKLNWAENRSEYNKYHYIKSVVKLVMDDLITQIENASE